MAFASTNNCMWSYVFNTVDVKKLNSLYAKFRCQKGNINATRNRKHRRAAAKPAACAPNAVNTREQGKEGGRVR